MTSLPKTMTKFGPGRKTRQIIYHSKGTYKSYPKIQNVLLLNLSHCVKRCKDFCQILAFLRRKLTKYGYVT